MNLFSGGNRVSRPKLNKFDLSHERKMSFNMGSLVPIMLQEVVPGDKFRVNTEIFMRLAPMLAPVMHRVNVWTHYFFVPNRLVWSEWEDFITGGRDGDAAPVYPFLRVTGAAPVGFGNGSLADYLGLPTMASVGVDLDVSALPFRAYQMIYNEFYRDQNLSDPIEFGIGSGEVTDPTEAEDLGTLRNRCWEKDYLTSALPWAQRGVAASAPGVVDYMAQSRAINSTSGGSLGADGVLGKPVSGGSAGTLLDQSLRNTGGFVSGARIENIESVATPINELRKAVKLQEWLERNARGGARYIEQILAHFGVVSSDARLQRPEYLGGGKAPVTISEVLSTFQDPDDAGEPQGNMAGHGVSVGNRNGFKRRFEEHGFVIGLVSVLPRTAYQQGVNRMWQRFDKFDHYFPEFAHLGEQEVKRSEVWIPPFGGPADNPTFGYQSRYCDMKYGQSSVHGDMRSSLAFWHMGRIFSGAPVLNEAFVTADPTHRIFAVDDVGVHKLWCQLHNSVSALRPMPYFGTPSI